MSKNSVLVTGGGSGIGLALATRFRRLDAEVIICGRNRGRLDAAKEAVPGLKTDCADLADADQREALVQSVLEIAPRLNVLVNNAGIQRRGSFAADRATWNDRAEEIAINLVAPLHLTSLLLPDLSAQPEAAIINASSGLAFLPLKFAAVYAATKAKLHAFTLALRADIASDSVRKIEIVPPAVDTELSGAGHHSGAVPVGAFAYAIMARLAAGDLGIGYGPSEILRLATRSEVDALLNKLNGGAVAPCAWADTSSPEAAPETVELARRCAMHLACVFGHIAGVSNPPRA